MGLIPRRQRRQRPTDLLAELHPELRRDLEQGYSFFVQYETLEEMQAAWAAIGEELLADYIAQHPGRRPFAWWLFSHGQERPLNPGGDRLADFIAICRSQARFGFLDTSCWGGSLLPMQEDQTFYLQRMGLLTATELQLIPFEEPEDETVDLGLRIALRVCRGPRLKRKEI
jgi:hypothetical protein